MVLIGRVSLALCLALGCEGGAHERTADPPDARSGSQPAPDPTADGPTKAPHFTTSKLETTVSGQGEGPYRFTAGWHKRRAAKWARALAPYQGKANLRYLEIGVFEGRSLVWMLEHILTDPSSTATVIDPFSDEYEQNFDANVAAAGAEQRVTKRKGFSETELRALAPDSFDIIYVDGSHTADDVLLDAMLSWDLLREGGVVIFDDYQWAGRPGGGVIPAELRPEVAVDAFVSAHRYEIASVDKGPQVFVTKQRNPCEVKDYCTPWAGHFYFWRDFELRTPAGAVVPLTDPERSLLETLLNSARFGEHKFRIDTTIRADPTYRALRAKVQTRPGSAPMPPGPRD